MSIAKLRICCFSGTGGTGKTKVIDELCHQNTHYFFLPSIVRSFYQMNGVHDEKAFFEDMSSKEKLSFQVSLLTYYMKTLNARAKDIEAGYTNNAAIPDSYPVLIMDRSIYDHIAYTVMYGMTEVDTDTFDYMQSLIHDFKHLGPRVVYFPFPTGWDYKNGDDGFRYRSWGKDLVHDSILRRLLRDYYTNGASDTLRFIPLAPATSIAERAKKVDKHIHAKWT